MNRGLLRTFGVLCGCSFRYRRTRHVFSFPESLHFIGGLKLSSPHDWARVGPKCTRDGSSSTHLGLIHHVWLPSRPVGEKGPFGLLCVHIWSGPGVGPSGSVGGRTPGTGAGRTTTSWVLRGEGRSDVRRDTPE